MSCVLVTGAQGFTAHYLLPRLIERGDQVHGLFRPGGPTIALPTDFAIHEADLTDLSAITDLVRRIRPQLVVHLAGISFVAHGDAHEMYESNLIGSRNLLQALVDARAQPSAVLLASSANVYGNQEGLLSEDRPFQPANDYGISKVAMELAARLYMDRLPIIIARPFNYTGVGQTADFFIPKIVDHVRRRSPVIELGNLDVERDFSDVREVASAYVRLLDCPEAVGGIFNVCSGRHHSLREVIALVEAISHHSMRIITNPSLIRRSEVHRLYGDNTRLAETIGGLQMPPLKQTLQWMIKA